jgi:hypothetical protein
MEVSFMDDFNLFSFLGYLFLYFGAFVFIGMGLRIGWDYEESFGWFYDAVLWLWRRVSAFFRKKS